MTEGVVSDLPERLRAELDRLAAVAQDAQQAGLDDEWPFWIDRDSDWDFEAAERWRNAFAPAVLLRTIEAHRKILKRHDHPHWCASDDFPSDACPDVRALASIYFPERS